MRPILFLLVVLAVVLAGCNIPPDVSGDVFGQLKTLKGTAYCTLGDSNSSISCYYPEFSGVKVSKDYNGTIDSAMVVCGTCVDKLYAKLYGPDANGV